jgi:hypothetical protein
VTTREPNFEDLVGKDLDAAERDRLLRVHELLVAAGPPPDLVPEEPPVPEPAAAAPAPSRVPTTRRWRRPRLGLVALAAALALAVFGAGYLVGDRSGGPEATVAMSGTAHAQGASASLELFPVDQAGNWPMTLEVKGLAPAASGRPYELWLTKGTKLAALCGSFRAQSDGTARVPMNAPYKLTDFDSWVIVQEGSSTPLLTT